jgi:hypothetical protein
LFFFHKKCLSLLRLDQEYTLRQCFLTELNAAGHCLDGIGTFGNGGFACACYVMTDIKVNAQMLAVRQKVAIIGGGGDLGSGLLSIVPTELYSKYVF